MNIPNLRSAYIKTSGLYYFARMIDKIRLHQSGTLPADYQPNLGKGFDGRCSRFLHNDYTELAERVKQGGSDVEILEWCFQHGHKPQEGEIEIWNTFMRKIGWRDKVTETLEKRKKESGLENRSDIQTIFDYLDADEGRPLVAWDAA